MSLPSAQILTLVDAQLRPFGQIELERTEGDLLIGKFQPGPGFVTAAKLFHDFEEAATCQALAAVDKLDAAIADLGLTVRLPDCAGSVNLYDVQIWSDGGITCRLRDPLPASLNGSAPASKLAGV